MHVRLCNGNMLGDVLAMTCLVRDLKTARRDWYLSVETPFPAIWENSPYLSPDESWPPADSSGKIAEHMRIGVGTGTVTQRSSATHEHVCEAFRVCWEEKTGIVLHQGRIKPELFLTDHERGLRPMPEPYWLVCVDASGMNSKRWVEARWQQVVDGTPWLRWVQVGRAANNRTRLRGQNVIDAVGRTDDLRVLFAWMANADGFLGLVSGPHHISAAFERPAVIISGAREPSTYEAYPWQRYLSTVGTVPCAAVKPCWACRIDPARGDECKVAPGRLVEGVPQCLAMITVDEVVAAIESYYVGGRLERPKGAAPKSITVPVRAVSKSVSTATASRGQPLLRVVSNGYIYGGAERSVVEIARMALTDGWRVELATRGGHLCRAMRDALPDKVTRTTAITDPCDALLLYASDMVFDFQKPEFEVFGRLQAKRKVMALTYKAGAARSARWAHGWDRYLFLSSAMRDAVAPKNGLVLAPPVDLKPFFFVAPNYDGGVRVVRHSSQGDGKWPRDTVDLVRACRGPGFRFMPGPSFLDDDEEPNVFHHTENEMPAPSFLARGNLFLYLLPDGYTDQGPRVVVEAMAAGLPVICQRRDGCADRVTEETGWFVANWREAASIINHVTADELRMKGTAARQRARLEFEPERWWDAIKR